MKQAKLQVKESVYETGQIIGNVQMKKAKLQVKVQMKQAKL